MYKNKESHDQVNQRVSNTQSPHIDKTAISPYDIYCDGYGMPGAQGNGYVSVLKVSVGTVRKTDDTLLDSIVAYDRAEIKPNQHAHRFIFLWYSRASLGT